MKKSGGFTLIELTISITMILFLFFGVGVTMKEAEIYRTVAKVRGISVEVNRGVQDALRLKRTNGCLTGVSISHQDLISVGVSTASVYPAPWTTSFSFGMRGSEPTFVTVTIDTFDQQLAGAIFGGAKADVLAGSRLTFRFPITSGRVYAASDMYRDNNTCWSHGVGAK